MKSFKLFVFLLSFNFLTACSKSDEGGQKDSKLAPAIGLFEVGAPDLRKIHVVDQQGRPLAKAQILIGSGQGQPFVNNFLLADDNGEWTAPAEWLAELPVTISVPGYIRATFMKQLPQGQNFTLRPQQPLARLELSGEAQGFSVVDHDDLVDFALVLPALRREDLFHFDISMVMSQETDSMSILGKEIKIPSNISLPTQHESYWLPVTIEKPNYRIYFQTPGTKKIFTARGQFPLGTIVDGAREKKPFYEMINYFTLAGGSLKDVVINGLENHADVMVNEIAFSQRRRFLAPSYGTDEILLVAGISEKEGYLVPTDIKFAEANKMQSLTLMPGGAVQVLSILKRKTEMKKNADRLSASLVPFADGVKAQHLPLMEDPRVQSPYVIQLSPVKNPEGGLTAVATMATLERIHSRESNGKTVETKEPLWDVVAPRWSAVVEIPVWPGEATPAGPLNWSVALLAGPSSSSHDERVDSPARIFNSVSHVTHSSARF